MVKDRMPVNLADPKDIKAKMPEIRHLLAKASQELEDLQEQVAVLARIVGEAASSPTTARTNPVPGQDQKQSSVQKAPKARRRAAPAQERAVQALGKAGRPMGPASLFRFMESEGMDMPTDVNALNASLWAAAKSGRLVKTVNGLYGLPGTPTDRPLTDYDVAAANGMPVPARLPGTNGHAPLEVPAS